MKGLALLVASCTAVVPARADVARGDLAEHAYFAGLVVRTGTVASLPALFGKRVQPSFGAELAVTIVRHGDQLMTDWISLECDRHVKDTISGNLFQRFDYVSAL